MDFDVSDITLIGLGAVLMLGSLVACLVRYRNLPGTAAAAAAAVAVPRIPISTAIVETIPAWK